MTASSSDQPEVLDTPQERPTAALICSWIVSYVAKILALSPEEVEVNSSIEDLGLDSAVVVALSGDLEEWLGFDIDPAIMFDAPTLATLAERLVEEAPQGD